MELAGFGESLAKPDEGHAKQRGYRDALEISAGWGDSFAE
jgi:hypothetical protein